MGNSKAVQSVQQNVGHADSSSWESPSLTLVIPAYNEAPRITETVREAIAWLTGQSFVAELIVVDDGSDDATPALAERAMSGYPGGRVIRIDHGGKAAAVRTGMLEATTDQIAFSDADLATPLTYLTDLRTAVAKGCDIAIGSREGVGARRIGEPPYRHIMGRVFNWLVRLLLVPGVHDTQCGFKLFRTEVARDLLHRSRLYRDQALIISGPRVTAFDVELLTIARLNGYRICSVPVVWHYGEGSKVRPARDTWHNVRDVLNVWIDARRDRYCESEAGSRE
ncbi:MAG TPA: dolichyl-phosphate beta-glucosyltransferase [Thermomicrobiales bacterium]|nr:dolichyl-phosphate beta-glucosyltransferase [Thermomicrobiales bacterium]